VVRDLRSAGSRRGDNRVELVERTGMFMLAR